MPKLIFVALLLGGQFGLVAPLVEARLSELPIFKCLASPWSKHHQFESSPIDIFHLRGHLQQLDATAMQPQHGAWDFDRKKNTNGFHTLRLSAKKMAHIIRHHVANTDLFCWALRGAEPQDLQMLKRWLSSISNLFWTQTWFPGFIEAMSMLQGSCCQNWICWK